jgi:hypothetical protein
LPVVSKMGCPVDFLLTVRPNGCPGSLSSTPYCRLLLLKPASAPGLQ